jgi:hypothetical protein
MRKPQIKTTLMGLAIAYLLEAIVLYVLTGITIWAMVSGEAKAILTDSALVVLTGGAALWLTFASRALLKQKRWARSAGVFWQLIQLTIAFGTFEANVIWGLAIALPSILVLITLFTKEVVQATSENRD